MKITRIQIRNFRRLERVAVEFEKDETVFVGPNNSGKTSAAAAFRCFLGDKGFKVHDLSVSKVPDQGVRSLEIGGDRKGFATSSD